MSGLKGDYEKFIAISRYARWREEDNRRETWEETVERLITFWEGRFPEHSKLLREEMQPAIYNTEVMPSMRTLMTAGKALDRDEVAGFNCSYCAIDNIRVFDEILYILCCGTGLGFSCERQYISKLPEVAEQFFESDSTVVVRDSKIGWAKAFKEVISLLYQGVIPKWDVSKVRPKGAKLKTFGGRASGSDPLVDLFQFTVELFQKAKGRKLNSLEVHDLVCKIADIVVVGGVRRSALISLSNLSDPRMRDAKSGQWWVDNPQRALANNSVAYTEKPDIGIFMEEWKSLYDSKSGERGVFSREAANKLSPQRRKDLGYTEWGTNPCCFTGGMRLLTEDGYERFSDLSGLGGVGIVNQHGDISIGEVWSSGVKPVVEVRFHGNNKDSILCTPDHVFMGSKGDEVQAKDLKGLRVMPIYSIKSEFQKDGFMAGFVQGDGNTGRLSSDTHLGLEVFFGAKDGDIAHMYDQGTGTWYSRYAMSIAKEWNLSPNKLPKRCLPDAYISTNFLSGLYSANGCVVKGHRVALKSTCYELITQVKEELSSLGISSYITTNKPKKVTFSNGDYVCKESYDLNIAKLSSVILFAELISFGQTYKRLALKDLILSKAPKVSSVRDAGVQEVYDFTEPETHWGVVEGCVVHNSEIILRSKQFCNLTEVVIKQDDTEGELQRKVRLATILGTMQASLTNFRYLSSAWEKNTKEEALLGVSFTGIMDNKLTNRSSDALPILLGILRSTSVEVNIEWAKKLGVNPASAITCVKPSGTVSQLVDSASGIHPRYSDYYIRTVRSDNKDPLCMMMKDQGFPWEVDLMKPDSGSIFSFPVKSPDSVMRDDRTAIEQCEVWKIYQLHWCEHKPSITVYVKEDEWLDVGAWVYKNFDIVSGISFLPHSDHSYKQAPYQEIDEQHYKDMLAIMPKSDWSNLGLYEKEDTTTGMKELACSAGACEII